MQFIGAKNTISIFPDEGNSPLEPVIYISTTYSCRRLAPESLHIYCTISNCSSVTHHTASGYGRNRSFVSGHRQSGQWPRPTDKYLGVTEPKKNRTGQILALVPHHNASCRWRKFVQRVTGHTPGRTIRNGTVYTKLRIIILIYYWC